jgi:hypothetical protein
VHCIVPGGVWRAPAKPLRKVRREARFEPRIRSSRPMNTAPCAIPAPADRPRMHPPPRSHPARPCRFHP